MTSRRENWQELSKLHLYLIPVAHLWQKVPKCENISDLIRFLCDDGGLSLSAQGIRSNVDLSCFTAKGSKIRALIASRRPGAKEQKRVMAVMAGGPKFWGATALAPLSIGEKSLKGIFTDRQSAKCSPRAKENPIMAGLAKESEDFWSRSRSAHKSKRGEPRW